eukprot:s134_g36.t1
MTDPGVAFASGREPPPPTWDGSEPAVMFGVFEKNVKLWEFESELPKEKRGVRLLRALTGIARAAADGLDFESIAHEKGVQNIMQKLKEQFAPHLELSMPRAFERAIYGQPRSHKEGIQEYIIRCERNFYLLEKEGVQLPDQAMGYVIFRQAALTEGQELRFGAWANGKYDKATVISCLRKLDKVLSDGKSKSSMAFLQDDEEASEGDETENPNQSYATEFEDMTDEDYVYLSEGQAERVFDETELQIVLATYQEVKRAIQSKQKGRQFYNSGKGAAKGKGRGSPWHEYIKDKKRIHIEQLKLRTRCAKCGTVGHWARECKAPPDERRSAHSTSSQSTGSKPASGASTTGGQSWYVASPGSCFLNVLSNSSFSICECGVDSTHLSTGDTVGVHSIAMPQEVSCGNPHMKGLGVVLSKGSKETTSVAASYFVGLTTSPSMAVVDTAAQDGLIGSVALRRLKEELKQFGLRVAWLPHKKARAHGVGGAANVLGSAAIPLGIQGNSGVLEVTVVEGDVPLLLPIKLLRELQASIDIPQSCMHLHRLQVTVELHSLLSGHLAMEVLRFGDQGFVCPAEVVHAGLNDSDFRWCSGSEAEGDMLINNSNCSLLNHGASGALPPRFESPIWRCAHASRARAAQSAPGFGKLASDPGQSLLGGAAAWARGVGQFMVAAGFDGDSILNTVFRAVGSRHQRCSRFGAYEVQDPAGDEQGCLWTSPREVGDGEQPARIMDSVLGLSCKMEDAGRDGQAGQTQSYVEEGGSRSVIDFSFGHRSLLGGSGQDEVPGEFVGATSPSLVGTERPEESRGRPDESGMQRYTRHLEQENEANEREALRWQRDLTTLRNTDSNREIFTLRNELQQAVRGLEVTEIMMSEYGAMAMGPSYVEHKSYHDGEMWAYAERRMKEETELAELHRLTSELSEAGSEKMAEKVSRWADAPGYEPKEVYVLQDSAWYRVNNYEDLHLEDECIVRVAMTDKAKYDEMIADEESETALSKQQKTWLRRAVQNAEGGCFAVDVAEVFSPPRITAEAKRQGLKVGGAYDLQTGYDLRDAEDTRRMWRELEEDDPELVVNSPPCTAFTPLQEWNLPKMSFEKAVVLVGEGLAHMETACDVAIWQHNRGKVFLLEQPRPSKAWEEEAMQRVLQLKGIYVCVSDMCSYGMRVNEGLNKKSTQWVTNSWHIAMELQRRCTQDHEHEPLTHGRAALAAVYPPELCRAIVRGLKRHLRFKFGKPEMPKKTDIVLESFAVEAEGLELDEFEDMLPEEVRVNEQEERRMKRTAAAVTEEDKNKVTKMHVNLGHPAKDSFVRFLRAGRVREEVIRSCRWDGSEFIPDPMNQRSLPVLNVVDLGTNYQMVELIQDKSPHTIWRAFWKTWCRTFGMPQYVSLDEGLEFRGAFSQWCAQFGTLVFRAATKSPWQQGKVERHGGLMKDLIEKARASTSIATVEELSALLYECEASKNRFMNRSGYSPVQRQIGQWPRMPGSLMSDEVLDPALQVQHVSDAFDRTLELRQIAQDAFMKLACKEAAAKSLRARTRIQRVFKAGDIVYVFRVLRKRKKVHGQPEAERGHGVGRRASWIGPGHVLAMEGSVVWLNMFGELWKAAVEQVREATTVEKLGVEVVAEDFSEMQERLKRSSRRAGFRDVTEDAEEMQDEDPVAKEGEERGKPRVRFEEEEEDMLSPGTPLPDDEVQAAPSAEAGPRAVGPMDDDDEDSEFRDLFEQPRRSSQATVLEPDEEAEVVQPNLADQQQNFDAQAEEEAIQGITNSIAHNANLDGVPMGYGRARERAQDRWRTMAPYVAEVFFLGEGEKEDMPEEPTHDYWVFDSHRNVLQRHHVHWRKAMFNPMGVDQSPIPLRAIKKERCTKRVYGVGQSEEITDEWSPFTKREERLDWWKGITEFKVDSHFLSHGQGYSPKRGEGEVFPHEIPDEEWPEWIAQDTEEFQKIVKSGALRILSMEESNAVREQLAKEGKSNRILPSRMVRRYKPGDAPGAPRTKKSRFCIRGDKDPDIADLARFAPTVTTSNLQVLIQAAVNHAFRGVIGDLKSAFTQSLPLVRKGGKLYCRSVNGSMPGLEEGQLAEIILGCYGLCDAPMHWRKTLVSFLVDELGYKQSALDPCTYLLHGPDSNKPGEKRLLGMVAVEIDDLLMFGGEEHEAKMSQLRKRFTFGKVEPLDEKGANFNGRRLRCIQDTVLVDMKAFVEERLEKVQLSPQRLKQKHERLTDEETGLVRKVCGSLNWAGREGRPDAAAAASMCSSMLLEMKVSDVIELNRIVARIKEHSELALKIQAIPESRMRWGVISDASWANARGGKTQGGHMLLAFDEDLLKGKQARCNLLHWKSGKLHRTVNSTLAAETQSLARGVGDLLWMMVMYSEFTDPDFQLRNWRRHVHKLGYSAFTKVEETDQVEGALAVVDAKSLYDLLANETGGGADRRTALDVQMLREELGELRGKVRWIDHMHMVADCLTKKQGRIEPLLRLLESGMFGITEEAVTLDSRLEDRKKAWHLETSWWQARRLATWTVTLCGSRGIHGIQLALVKHVGLRGTASLCVAGVALGGMDLHFVWQAWHLATWTFALCGRRGACGAQLALVMRLGRVTLCGGVALGGMDLHFVWQTWRLVTWAFTLCGRRCNHGTPGSCDVLGSRVGRVTLCGRRGTYGALLALVTRLGPGGAASLCVAGVAFDIDLHFVWQVWQLLPPTFILCGRCGARVTRGTGLALVAPQLFHTQPSYTQLAQSGAKVDRVWLDVAQMLARCPMLKSWIAQALSGCDDCSSPGDLESGVGAPGDFGYSQVEKQPGYLHTYRDLRGMAHVRLLDALTAGIKKYLERMFGESLPSAHVSAGFHYPVRPQYSTLHLQIRVNSGNVCPGEGRGVDLFRLHHRLKLDPMCFQRDDEELSYEATANLRAALLKACDKARLPLCHTQ